MRDKIAVISVGVTSFVMGSLVTRRSCNKELNAFEAEKEDIRDLAKNTEIIERIHSIGNKSVRICQLNQFNRLVAEALSARDMKSLNKSVEEINVFFRSLKELTSESYHVDEEINDEVDVATGKIIDFESENFDKEIDNQEIDWDDSRLAILNEINTCNLEDIEYGKDLALYYLISSIMIDTDEESKYAKMLLDLFPIFENEAGYSDEELEYLSSLVSKAKAEFSLMFKGNEVIVSAYECIEFCAEKLIDLCYFEDGQVEEGDGEDVHVISDDIGDSGNNEGNNEIGEENFLEDNGPGSEDQVMGGESSEESQEIVQEEIQVEENSTVDVDNLISELVVKFGKRYKENIQNTLYMLSLDSDKTLQINQFDKVANLIDKEDAQEDELVALLASIQAAIAQ